MRPKSIVLLLLALGCGLVASIGITQVIKRPPQEIVIKEGMSPILVAKSDVPMGEVINPANVKLESWPKDSVPAGALTKLSDIEGRRLRTEIFSGEAILAKKLLPKGATTSTATEFIPRGYRVVSVDVDKSDGAGMIMPGDRVDVILHVRRNQNLGISEDRTQTILQDVKVFAVNDTFKLGSKEKSNVSISAKTISLLVTPQQAEKLDLGSQLGKIRLVMRGLEDKDVVAPGSISVADLLGNTEGSDREAEEKEQDSKSKDKGLLGFLNGMGKKKVKETSTADQTVIETPRTWSVRVLQGGNMEDVTLREIKEGGLVQWRVQGEENHPGYSMAEPAGGYTPMAVPARAEVPQDEEEMEEEPDSDSTVN